MKFVAAAVLVLVACKPPNPGTEGDTVEQPQAAAGAATAKQDAVPPFPGEPPAEIETKKLEIGAVLEFADAEVELREVAAAADGQFLCLAEIFADENRVVATSSPDCFRKPRDLDWKLYAVDEPRELLTFDRFLGYSDALDTIAVKGGVEEKSWNLQTTTPSGGVATRTVWSRALTTFVSLADGATQQVEGDVGEDHFHFVQGRGEVVVTGYEPPMDRSAGVHLGVVTGIPATRPTLTAPNPYPVVGEVSYDEAADRFVFTSSRCARVTVTRDGSEVECAVQLPDEYTRYSNRRMDGGWFVAWMSDTPPIAVNLATGKQVNPAEGTCAAPMYPHVPSEAAVPRILMACAGEGRPAHEFTKMYLWAPDRRLEVPGGPWRPDVSSGHFIAYSTPGGWTPESRSARWLDLRRYIAWDVGELYLLGRRIALDAGPLGRKDVITAFLVDQERPSVQPMAELECARGFMLAYEDDEVVSIICQADPKGEKHYCGSALGPVIDYAVTWDTRTGKRYRTRQPVVGATKDAILFADSTKMRSSENVCEPTKLLAARR